MFSRWRTIVILFLLFVPALTFVGFAVHAMWGSSRLLWMGLTLPVCWVVAYLLVKWWGKDARVLDQPQLEEPAHWTPRDPRAWEIVDARIQSAGEIESEQFAQFQFWIDTGRDLAQEIAVAYHPDATDPISSLTIPEIMAAVQLALEDISEVYDDRVPGGHLMTVSNWKSLSKLPGRVKMASNVANVVGAFVSPVAAASRYFTGKAVRGAVMRWLQGKLILWFYEVFLQRAGFYLIEMNSGRLRGGKEKFREAFERLKRGQERPWEETEPTDDPAKTEADEKPAESNDDSLTDSALESTMTGPEAAAITICVVGQSGSGRSSVVRGLLGDKVDEIKRLKKASTVTVHRMRLPESTDDLRLLETIGYSNFEESKSIGKDRFRAIAQSDLLLVVINAVGESREADVEFLDDVAAWFDEKPHLKPPAALAVLTHIDRLEPAVRWSPPYNWREPSEMKEQSIRDAVERVRAALGGRAVDVVPVCADVDNQRAFGIQEWLEPAIAAALEDARAVSTVRNLHDDLGQGGVSRVLKQVWNIGKALRGK